MVWFFVACSLTCMKTKGTDCHSIISLRKSRLKKGDRERERDEVAGRAPNACCSVFSRPQRDPIHQETWKETTEAAFSKLPWFSNDVTTPSALHELILLALGPGPSELLCAETVHQSPARTKAWAQESSCSLWSAPVGVRSALKHWLTSSMANEKCRLVPGFNVKIKILNLKV